MSWIIKEAKSGGFVAESDTGVRIWADAREKLDAWLDGRWTLERQTTQDRGQRKKETQG